MLRMPVFLLTARCGPIVDAAFLCRSEVTILLPELGRVEGELEAASDSVTASAAAVDRM